MKEKQLRRKERKESIWGWILAVLLLSISMGTVEMFEAPKLKLNKTKITVYKGCTETLKVIWQQKESKMEQFKKGSCVCFSLSGKIKGKKKKEQPRSMHRLENEL